MLAESVPHNRLPDAPVGVDPPFSARRRRERCAISTATATALFVTTDRLSAFDRILAWCHKGQVLTQLAAVVC